MKPLPNSDQQDVAAQLLRIATGCAAATGQEEFTDLVRQAVRKFLPHETLIAVLGRIDLEHLELVHIESVDYPAEGIQALQPQSNVKKRPALMRWLATREPIVLDPELDGALMSLAEREEIARLKLGRVAAHGVVDLVARSGSYFSFGGIPCEMPAGDVVRRLKATLIKSTAGTSPALNSA